MLKKAIAALFIAGLTCTGVYAADTTGEVWLNKSVLTVDQNEYLDSRENLKLCFSFDDFNTNSIGNSGLFYEKSTEVYVLLTGAEWSEELENRNLGKYAYVEDVDGSYLKLSIRANGYLDSFNFELPVYCHVNSLGEIRADIEGAITDSVLIANSTNGDIDITLGRQDMGTSGTLKPLTISDSSTVHYNKGDEIRLELDNNFIFTDSPTLKGEGKFDGTCEFTIDEDNPSIAYIVFTSNTPDTDGTLVVEDMAVSRPSGRPYKVASLKINFESGAVDISRSFPVANYTENATSETTTESTTETAVKNSTNTDERSVEIQVGSYYYTVNGEPFEMDSPALIDAGYTYLPLRYAANAAGISDNDITYYNAEKTAYITYDDTEISITANSNIMYVDGKPVILTAPAKIIDNRMYLPMRPLAEALGAQSIEFDNNTKIATIIF